MGRVIGETLNNGHAKRRTMAMQSFNENWDGIQRSKQQSTNEAFHSFTPKGGKQGSQMNMQHFTDMDELSKKISAHAKDMKSFNPNLGGTNAEARGTLLNIAETLLNAHRQQQDFMKGLIYHIEGVHKKVMSPSRHGNMEILNDLSDIIRELKKYQK
jgi:hypothetical protein